MVFYEIIFIKKNMEKMIAISKVAKTRVPQRVDRATLYSNESRDGELSIEYRVYGVFS